MRIKLDNNLTDAVLEAVTLLSNSFEEDSCCSDYRYKASIAYLYKILSIIYAENHGILPEKKLIRQIEFARSSNENYQFENIVNIQLDCLGIKTGIFSNFPNISIEKQLFPDFIKVLKIITTFSGLNIDSFGYLYNYLQQYELIINEEDSGTKQLKLGFNNAEFAINKSNILKKKQGSFFTPPDLISRLLGSSLTRILSEVNTLNDLLSLRILDPACGGGNILLHVFEMLFDKARNELNQSINPDDLKKLILKNCIFGTDIDEFACEITKLSLFLQSGRIEHFDSIACGNFLIEDLDNYEKTIKAPFLKEKFSLIIGNPPYLNIQNIAEIEKKYYISRYKSAFRRFDIYVLFVEKSLQLLKDNGFLSFILPDKFLTQSYARKIRKIILENHTVKEIIGFKNQDLFNAAVNAIIISIIKNKQITDIKTIEISQKCEEINFISQDTFSKMYNLNFRIGWNIHKQEIIELIQAKSFPLSELCYISWGAQPGNAKKFIYSSPHLVKTDYQGYLKPLIRGGNIDRYGISYANDYLLYLTEGEMKLHRPAFRELFENEKIVVAEVSANRGIIASLDNNYYYTNHSIINCIHKKELIQVNPDILSTRGVKILNLPESNDSYKWQESELAYTRGTEIYTDSEFNSISLKYCLSILNSKLINYYFNNYLSGELNVFPELVRFLPVFNPGLISGNSYLIYYETLLNNDDFNEADSLLFELIASRDYTEIHNFFSLIAVKLIKLKADLNFYKFSELDNILNRAVYSLYGLNRNQIILVETGLSAAP